jgi:hypothetical protein
MKYIPLILLLGACHAPERPLPPVQHIVRTFYIDTSSGCQDSVYCNDPQARDSPYIWEFRDSVVYVKKITH